MLCLKSLSNAGPPRALQVAVSHVRTRTELVLELTALHHQIGGLERNRV